jgi:hypothetical protein
MGQSGRELTLYVDWINSHPIQYETQPEPGPPISRLLDWLAGQGWFNNTVSEYLLEA